MHASFAEILTANAKDFDIWRLFLQGGHEICPVRVARSFTGDEENTGRGRWELEIRD
jgi:hypothetical protein